jgi:hypothetical protein
MIRPSLTIAFWSKLNPITVGHLGITIAYLVEKAAGSMNLNCIKVKLFSHPYFSQLIILPLHLK